MLLYAIPLTGTKVESLDTKPESTPPENMLDDSPDVSNTCQPAASNKLDSESQPQSTATGGASLIENPPLSVEGPPLPPDDIPERIVDYSVVLKNGRSVRGYQSELAQPGKEGKNYIIVAPTGSGKTLVAALVISDHLQKGIIEDDKRKVVFIVEKRPLAQQQAKQLQDLIPATRVVCCTGDDVGNTIKDSLKDYNIIVCTSGKLFDDIKGGRVSPKSFSLMVFDECHHTRKKSPYAEIMTRYLKLKEKQEILPQVIGLTASPGAGDNRNLEKVATIKHLVYLCALMDATYGIKTVQAHKAELEAHTNKPDYTIEKSRDRDSTEPFIRLVDAEMQFLEKEVGFTCPFERWSQKYETQVQQKKFVLDQSTNADSRNEIRILNLLRYYGRALDVYMELQYEDAVSVLDDTGLPSLEQANPFERRLRGRLDNLLFQLKKLPRVDNPHLQKVQQILGEQFSSNPESRVMLFVRTKKHASSIHHWISSLSIAKVFGICPCVVVGQDTGVTGGGMTQAEQEDSFQKFREGRSKLLVVTSIGEEGIDVPACNVVLRYQHVSNEIAKAQTLGRARAPGTSEGYTILSSHKKQRQEVKNGELLALVNDILEGQQFPTGRYLLTELKKAQAEILMQYKLEHDLRSTTQSQHKAEDVKLLCKCCKTFACSASDIRLIGDTARVVPGEEFSSKINKKEHLQPVQKQIMNKTHKIFCKKCDSDWGVSCIWPNYGFEFPVLGCKSFTFVIGGVPMTFKKWSIVPFTIEPFIGFPSSDEDEEPTD